jgi:SPP1 gp7 family putative phage head morphogenesis protein
MSQQLSRELAGGLAQGLNPREIARNMASRIDGLTRRRANVLARTEVIHAHAEGQLDSFKDLGVEEVGVMAEWSTAGDDRVCDLCFPLEGAILTVDEARGLIPRHPQCRCTWVPSTAPTKSKLDTRAKVRQSVVAGAPKSATTLPAAVRDSTWAGKRLLGKKVKKKARRVVAKKKRPKLRLRMTAKEVQALSPSQASESISALEKALPGFQSKVDEASSALSAARKTGDFKAIGKARDALERADDRFDSAFELIERLKKQRDFGPGLKTIKDAEARIERLTGGSAFLNGDRMALRLNRSEFTSYARLTNEAADEIERVLSSAGVKATEASPAVGEFSLEVVGKFGADDFDGLYTVARDMTVRVNQDALDAASFKLKPDSGWAAGAKRYTVAKEGDVRHTIVHEFGHAYHLNTVSKAEGAATRSLRDWGRDGPVRFAGGGKSHRKKFSDVWEGMSKAERGAVSEYGSEDEFEFYAECFSLWHSGDPAAKSSLPAKIQKVFTEEFGG